MMFRAVPATIQPMTSLLTDLHSFFSVRRDRGEPMVLATIVRTAGSTYRKTGAQMLIAPDGAAAGLLSGGCLESDLIAHAQQVLQRRTAQLVSYDTRSEDDLLWGIGLGCEGAMDILLTALHVENGYQPFAYIDAMRTTRARTAFALVVQPGLHLPLGQAFQLAADSQRLLTFGGEELPIQSSVTRSDAGILTAAATRTVHIGEAALLVVPIELSLKLLIAGAGPDVQPLAHIAALLGWQTTIVDHRPAYAVAERFPASARIVLTPASEVAAAVDLNAYDAAVVMSHHLTSDAAYLRALASSSIRYIGLLGPAPRRARLLRELGADGDNLMGRLRGPVGLDIGASSPETIALAIASEIQAALSGHSGRPFSDLAAR